MPSQLQLGNLCRRRKVVAGNVIPKPFNLRKRINCQVINLSSTEYGSESVGEWRNLWHSLNRDFLGKLFVVNVKFPPWGDICGKIMKNRYYKCINHNLLIFKFLSQQYNLTLVSAFEKVGMEMLQRPDPGRMGAIITLAISHLIASDGLTSGTDLGISSLISDPPKAFAYCQERDRKSWGTALNPLNLLTPFDAVTWLLVLITILTAALLKIQRGIITALFESWSVLLKSHIPKFTVVLCIWSLSGTLITYGLQ